MSAPTFITSYASTLSGTTTPKSTSVTVAIGDVLVVGILSAEPLGNSFTAPSGGSGFTWTQRQVQQLADNGAVAVYTAIATVAQTFNLSVARPQATNWGFVVHRYGDSDGVGASSKGASDGAPMSLALTTGADNSAISFFAADWNESAAAGTWRTINGITPTAGNGGERTAQQISGWYTAYSAYWSDAGAAGSKTTGMTVPATPNAGMVAIEILGSAEAVREITPTEDTMVAENNAAFVYGAEDQLSARTATGTTIESYLRFTLPALPSGRVLARAQLRVFTSSDPTAASVGTHPILLMTGTWDEDTTNWNNRPTTGFGAEIGLLSGLSALSTSYSTDLDVSAILPLLGTSMAICLRSNSTDNFRIRSSNFASAGTTAPTIILTFRDGYQELHSVVIDNFDDADESNGGLWSTGGGYTLEDSGGTRNIILTAAALDKQYFETPATEDFSAGEKWYGIELVDPGDIFTNETLMIAPMRMFPSNDSGRAFWRIRTGEGGPGTVVQPWADAGGFSPVGDPMDFDVDVHRFFAIGVGASGDIEWLYSPDGENWVLHYSMANPWGVTSFKKFGGEIGPDAGTDLSATTVRLDNFMLLTVEEAVPEGTANFDLDLSLAVESPGQGTANFDLNLSIDAEGTIPTSPSEGTAQFDLNLSMDAAGIAPTIGSAGSVLSLTLAATGANNLGNEGTANFVIDLSLAATGVAVVLTPVRVLTDEEILTGNRTTRYRWDVLDANDNPVAVLDGSPDGELDWIANAMVKGGGKLRAEDVGITIDWTTVRFRPVMLIDGLPEQPLGVFLVSEAPEFWARGRSWRVKLLDKTTILDQDTIAETFALAAGTVVTTAVKDIIEGVGILNHAITVSAATLVAPLVWEPGTKKLRIINDLLSSINYFSLYANFQGQLIAEPYVLPANRPIVYEFIDGNKSIYNPEFQRDVDLWSIPNRVTAVSQGDGVTAALTSTLDNTDPASPYSIPSRGRVIGYVETGVEAADQATLDAYVRRRLVELTSPTASVEIKHAPVPGLAVNQAVRFRRVPANIDHRHVVSKTALKLRGNALAKSTFREVVDL